MPSFDPIRVHLLPKFFLILFFVQVILAEVAVWKDNVSEFREDGSCWMINQSKGTSSPKTLYGNSSKKYFPCDPKYELMRQCQMASFYRDKLPEESEVSKTDDGTLLFLVDGCLQCPAGDAEANILLINSFPSGNWFSGCDEQRIVVSAVNAMVKAPSTKDGVERDGTFSLGGVLRERECGGFFGIGKGREGSFQSLMLEISHNCGRKKSMLLKVKLPKLNISAVKTRGKIAELKGISVDLDISKGGWDLQIVEYGMVRPKQTVPEEPTKEEGTFGGRQLTQTHVETQKKAEEQREEAKEKHTVDPPVSDHSPSQNGSATDQRRKEDAVSATDASTLFQFIAIALLFLLLLLFGSFVRCFLRRRRR